IAIQSEMSVRNLMATYAHADLLMDEMSLQDLTHQLKQDLNNRLKRTGTTLTEIRVIPELSPEKDIITESAENVTEKLIRFIEKEYLSTMNDESRKPIESTLTTALYEEYLPLWTNLFRGIFMSVLYSFKVLVLTI